MRKNILERILKNLNKILLDMGEETPSVALANNLHNIRFEIIKEIMKKEADVEIEETEPKKKRGRPRIRKPKEEEEKLKDETDEEPTFEPTEEELPEPPKPKPKESEDFFDNDSL